MTATPQQAPASAQKPLVTGTATVTVACKLPMGHRARLHAEREQTAIIGGIAQKSTQFWATGEEYLFKGPAHGQNEGPRVVTANGFALTFGVPADFWDKWYAQHKELDLVKSGLIFAHERRNMVADQAKEKKDLRSGLERIDPTRPMDFGGVKVEVADNSPVKLGRLDSDED